MLSFIGAYITAIVTQAVATGAYFASFLVCVRWLVFSDDGGTLRKGINWPLLVIAVILFAFSITDLSISLQATLLISEGRGNGRMHTSELVTVSNLTIIIVNCKLNSLQYFVELLAPIITDSVLVCA
jgi:hypothetical protein